MTDLLYTLPDFPTKSYTHLLPSLEKHLITTTDLITLDALEIAKRAQLPLLDVRRLANHVVATLQGELGLGGDGFNDVAKEEQVSKGISLKRSGTEVANQWATISTLDNALDAALGGGIPTGYITEITGESSGAGKTQLLLTLLLSAQLSPPRGLSSSTLYISTEHPLSTTRLTQLIANHPILSVSSSPPSLSRILTLQTPDLESQDHILTYQLPIALERHNVGLVVLDSIAANYRAERDSLNVPSALAVRSTQLLRLGAQLRSLARIHNCAIVVANQVADRFLSRAETQNTHSSSPRPTTTAHSDQLPSSLPSSMHHPAIPQSLSFDHQLRFFTGWGSHPSSSPQNLKTPSLGLVWTNQIACRIALIKEVEYGPAPSTGVGVEESVDWDQRRWRRWMRIVFASWVKGTEEGDRGVEFEVWAGGLRAVGSVNGGEK